MTAMATPHGRPENLPGNLNRAPMLELLRDVPGCPVLIVDAAHPGVIQVADFGGVPLSQSGLPGQLTLKPWLRIAESLAEILAAIHERRVIHKDLRPDTILIRPDDLSIQITHFDSATRFAEESPAFDAAHFLMERLRYISPEQTGRMHRPVDYRTDLYSLGATLYNLATGVPPFEDPERLALIHAHLAREPRPPQQLATWLPEALSRMILILLAKEPDQRYQSAMGLRHDLRAIREALETSTALSSVRLQTNDLPLSPRKPCRLRGRETEMTALRNAYAAVQQDGARGIFVAGYSGVGKTSLILELQWTVALEEGRFVQGKFDQLQRDQPFLAPAQSLNQLCQLLLAEAENRSEDWRQRLLEALGPDLGALFEVAPDLETLLGAQETAPELDPVKAMVRLRGLLVELLRAVSSPGQPLVMFLDDLQWADQPSLDFIAALLQEDGLAGFLLVGSYRDNEVDSGHPLTRVLNLPTRSGKPPECLTLTNLPAADIQALLTDMLGGSLADLAPLAELVIAKTGGNPYFTIEFIGGLYREGLLRPERGVWVWDQAGIAAHPASGNVVEFLARELSNAPRIATDTLIAAACLGDACTLGELAVATGAETGELVQQLVPALERGVVVTPGLLAFQQGEPEAVLRFCHDRMRQAVYLSRDARWLALMHLNMARRFGHTGQAMHYRLRSAEHYGQAMSLIVDAEERTRARELLMLAARHTRKAGSFAAAERLVRQAIELLYPAGSADTSAPGRGLAASDPVAALALHAELHLLLYSQSRHAEADELYARLTRDAAEPEQLVEPACIQIMSLSNRTLYGEALQLAARLLEALGMPVPLEDPLPDLRHELELFYRHAGTTTGVLLPREIAPSDPRTNGIANLMNRAIPAAFFSDPMVAFWLAVRSGRLWIDEGYRDISIYPAATITLACIAMRDDYQTGYRIARAALEIDTHLEHGVETARGLHVFGLLGAHWFQPLDDDLEYARAAFEGLMRGGELEFACFTHYTTLAALADTGAALAELQAEISIALGFARKYGNRHAEEAFLAFRQFARTLGSQTAIPGDFDDAEFDERKHLESIEGNPMARVLFYVYRALAAALFDQDEVLRHHAGEAYSLKSFITGFYSTALVHTLHALALIRQLANAGDAERAGLLQALTGDLDWLAARAADAPMNFGHLRDWLEAERLAALGETAPALLMFEQAMRGVRAQRRPWHQALITERAGRCYLRHGLEQAGRSLLTSACDAYRDWGAHGKVAVLYREWPFLGLRMVEEKVGSAGKALDYQALLHASQALAAERSLPRLVDRIVTLLAQLTGATDVRLLMLDEAGRWYLEGGIRGTERLDRMPLEAAQARHIIATTGMQLALKTQQPIVSEDAVIDSRFAGDPHFASLPLCSLLGLPIFLQGRLTAFLVLENRLLRAAFTTEHADTLSMLCGQLTVSIENIRVYQSLERKVAERTEQLAAANAAKSQFLASMSHEIRTPMNAVLGLAQLLQDEPLTEDQLQMVHRINTAGRSLLSIINDILDFSKIEAGQLSVEQRPFKLTELLSHIDNLMGPAAQSKGLILRLQEEVPMSGRLSGDALRIEQVLINLVGNALKFTEQGGVTLRVTPIAITEASARLRFEIEDTGIGMNPEAVAKLFTPFTQADSGIARRFGGTGLGLSISKRLVDLMGGEIGVTSTPYVGSTFWFELPFDRLPDEEKPESSATEVKGPRLQGLRLMVVDDSQINLYLAERVLKREGAEVTLMKDGQQALDALRANPQGYDLVLMDIQMPVMDGLAATRAIREELGLVTLPVIALTAGVLAEEKQNALDAGVNDFLPKPMDLDLMAGMIRSYCPAKAH